MGVGGSGGGVTITARLLLLSMVLLRRCFSGD